MSENETRADILREMREAAKTTDLFNGEEVGEPLIRGGCVEDWADRIEEAVQREHDSFQRVLNSSHDAANRMELERNTARTERDFARRGICRDCWAETDHGPMTLDAAIRHASERADETPCGRDHEQLPLWLMELRTLRESTHGNSAAMRDKLSELDRDAHEMRWDRKYKDAAEAGNFVERVIDTIREVIEALARNCDATPEKKIVRRDCINWSNNDHCARFGGISCGEKCWAYRPYKQGNKGGEG